MSKKAILSFPISMQSDLFDQTKEETLYSFRYHVSQLKEEVNRLSFMMSEIRNVLESSSSTKNSMSVF